MTGTTNTELRDYQRRVKGMIDGLRRQVSWSGFDRVERDLGLDNLLDEQQVTVVVTVPAGSDTEARQTVEQELNGLHLPTGWSASVSG
jgi:hypothetical protein